MSDLPDLPDIPTLPVSHLVSAISAGLGREHLINITKNNLFSEESQNKREELIEAMQEESFTHTEALRNHISDCIDEAELNSLDIIPRYSDTMSLDIKYGNQMLDQHGTGINQKVMLAVAEWNAKQNEDIAIFLYDEPDTYLDYENQKIFLEKIKALTTGEKNIAIMVTSHSPLLLDMISPESVWYIKKKGQGPEKLKNAKEISRALGGHISELMLSNNVLLVEGPSDKELLKYVWEKLFHKTPLSEGVLIKEINGCLNFTKSYKLFIGQDKKVQIIADSDAKSKIDPDEVEKDAIHLVGKKEIEDCFPVETWYKFFENQIEKSDIEVALKSEKPSDSLATLGKYSNKIELAADLGELLQRYKGLDRLVVLPGFSV